MVKNIDEGLNLNNFIVSELNEKKEEILSLCPNTTKEIEFSATYETITEVFDVKENNNWITLENPVKTQAIEIYTYEEFTINDTKENSLKIFLNDNSVSGNYFKNAGVSLEATYLIIKTIENIKDINQFIK